MMLDAGALGQLLGWDWMGAAIKGPPWLPETSGTTQGTLTGR
jgi:hypothetical protein